MVKRGLSPQEQKSYTPSEALSAFIEKKLELLKKDESSRDWDAKKVYYLDKLFQSMADLIYFLEMTAANPKLRETFEQDLEDLLDVRPYRITKGLPAILEIHQSGMLLTQTNLLRLVYASLIPHDKNYKNFRLKLLSHIQLIIHEKMWSIMQDEYGYSTQIAKSVLEDMGRALGWTAMLSKPKEYDKEKPSRVIDFSHPYKRG